MHYSEKQKEEIKRLESRIETAEKAIQEFRKHLASPKFYEDTTIQIKDVEARLLNLLDDLRGSHE